MHGPTNKTTNLANKENKPDKISFVGDKDGRTTRQAAAALQARQQVFRLVSFFRAIHHSKSKAYCVEGADIIHC